MTNISTIREHQHGGERFLARRISFVVLLLAILSSSGCMRRRITVRTNPPGALLFVDNQEVGQTPASFYVNYYGTRDIRLIKDGYKTAVTKHTFRTPWYQVPPFDLISDNFLFREQRDERVLSFVLEPMPNVDSKALQGRADATRQRAEQGTIVAPLPIAPAPGYPPVAYPGPGYPTGGNPVGVDPTNGPAADFRVPINPARGVPGDGLR